uniref:RING-type domain-containing protein n=1 Tax=Lotus japonicus TaxID=34305 RepID=I3SKD5_LOTJA|nr:unknown [Lotus japonicus]
MEDDAAASNKCDSSSCCPICLGPFLQLSYLDKCFHEFCFNCILRWSKVAAGKHHSPPSSVKCPLCKVWLILSFFNFLNTMICLKEIPIYDF